MFLQHFGAVTGGWDCSHFNALSHCSSIAWETAANKFYAFQLVQRNNWWMVQEGGLRTLPIVLHASRKNEERVHEQPEESFLVSLIAVLIFPLLPHLFHTVWLWEQTFVADTRRFPNSSPSQPMFSFRIFVDIQILLTPTEIHSVFDVFNPLLPWQLHRLSDLTIPHRPSERIEA